MDNNINLTILNELNKACQMGMDSITFVSDKVGDENLKENLSYQYAEYGNIAKKISTAFEKYGEIPDDEPVGEKMMGWMGIQMNTLTDKSNSKIAELLIQGGDMGIIECQKLLNHNPHAEENVKNLLNEFMNFQRNSIDKMKEFL